MSINKNNNYTTILCRLLWLNYSLLKDSRRHEYIIYPPQKAIRELSVSNVFVLERKNTATKAVARAAVHLCFHIWTSSPKAAYVYVHLKLYKISWIMYLWGRCICCMTHSSWERCQSNHKPILGNWSHKGDRWKRWKRWYTRPLKPVNKPVKPVVADRRFQADIAGFPGLHPSPVFINCLLVLDL